MYPYTIELHVRCSLKYEKSSTLIATLFNLLLANIYNHLIPKICIVFRYMCQINTDPMKSQVGYLDVVGEY